MNSGAQGATPKQAEILHLFLARGQVRPTFDPGFVASLRESVADNLARLLEGSTAQEQIFMSKWTFSKLLRCQGLLFEDPGFSGWTLAAVRGRLAHAAIEKLIISNYAHPPLDLVEHAYENLSASERPLGLAEFLQGLHPFERLEVLEGAVDVVSKFLIDWPHISRRWIPRIETPVYCSFASGQIVCQGRVDIVLGVPKGNEARSMLIDLKTGQPSTEHSDHLRFYALLEAFVRGTPPFRAGSYFLDSGTFSSWDVTEEVLTMTAEHLVTTVERLLRISTAESLDDLSLHGGPHCKWCIHLQTCSVGNSTMAQQSRYA